MFIVSPESGRIANSHPTPGNQPATGKSTRRSKDGKPNHGQAISSRYDAVSVKRDSISRCSQNAPLFGNLTKRTVALRVTFLPLTGALCDWDNSHRKKNKMREYIFANQLLCSDAMTIFIFRAHQSAPGRAKDVFIFVSFPIFILLWSILLTASLQSDTWNIFRMHTFLRLGCIFVYFLCKLILKALCWFTWWEGRYILCRIVGKL